jgi:hypothetical protein
MHDFIDALRTAVPRDLHPSAQEAIRWHFVAMRDAVADPVRVLQLMAGVRQRITDELRFERPPDA